MFFRKSENPGGNFFVMGVKSPTFLIPTTVAVPSSSMKLHPLGIFTQETVYNNVAHDDEVPGWVALIPPRSQAP